MSEGVGRWKVSEDGLQMESDMRGLSGGKCQEAAVIWSVRRWLPDGT